MPEDPRPPARLQRSLSVAGRAIGRAAITVGRGAQAAWQSVDPDVLRHLAQLPVLGLTMLGPSRPPFLALPDDGHRPVLFVHGMGGHRGNFLPMRSWFRLIDRTRTYAVGFTGHATIDDMVSALREAIGDILRVNALPEGTRIDMVAHSLGGIVARLALEDTETSARVAHLVTLGTPHGGTHAARFAHTKLALDLRPDSEMVARLHRQLPWPGPPTAPRLACFWSAADMLLLPSSTGCVQGAVNIEMPGFTHYSYLLQPSGWKRVAQELAQP